MFIMAAKKKFRFETPKGFLTVEDLFDCPLISRSGTGVSLDNIAKGIHRQLKATEDESFVLASSKKDTELETKLEIVKYVIAEKKAELKRRETLAANKAKREKILEIIASKEDDGLRQSGVDDLKKMLAEMEAVENNA